MEWLVSIFRFLPVRPPPDDRDGFTRRERDLQQRLRRLSQEVDVIQRVSGEEPRE